jgi:multicomponent Na+:H+ antiporter subunit G
MSEFSTVATYLLAFGGALLIVVAGLGMLRMPDLPTRMHASSKAGTLGAVLLLLAVAVHAADFEITLRAALICLFLFLTAPVAAHMIARAAYHGRVPLSDETVLDELREREFATGDAPSEPPDPAAVEPAQPTDPSPGRQ